MKDKNNLQAVQKRKKKLDKSRSILQNRLESKHDESSIIQTLTRIRSIDRERYMLFKISGGAMS
ncbi:hypothetical protein C0389_00325 [bacterium]|nr:hypothetical protein [bacterium]